MAKKSKNNQTITLDETKLSPRAKVLLDELSKELKLSKEVVAKLAVMMYRLYKDKR